MKAENPKTEPGRTHAERRREAERRILSAALEIVAERGLDGLTLQEAGEAAGFSRALPAHYYGSREVMLAAVVEQVITDYRQRLLASEYGRLEGLPALLAGVSFFVEEARRSPQGLKAFYEVTDAAARRPPGAPTVLRLNDETLEATIVNIQTAMTKGEVRADLEPRLEAVLFLATLRGLMTHWLGDPDQFDLEAARDALIGGLRRNWALD
ncbi:MAG: TetR/AcrR family transcriptional regulator [Caulobacteraceae bacterium]|nr:TetR/AcrR family transcriptional regulator [Caulobacteraceae bacterium]